MGDDVGPLVSGAWLAGRLGDDRVVVADVRWYLDGRSGRAAYEAGHLPGAVHVDVDGDLAGPPGGVRGRHPLPEPEDFAEAMGRLGIGDDDFVVAYDDTGGACAARLWWMLTVTGHAAAVLDGGMATWPGPLETAVSARPPARFTARPWPAGRVADAALVERLRQDPAAAVIDARARERFRGDLEPVDTRAGHVPGARNLPWTQNLDPATGRFLPPAELRARYVAAGVRRDTPTVVYCGSGVTACHDLLALAVAGVHGARLFAASWSGWSADAARPVATGDG